MSIKSVKLEIYVPEEFVEKIRDSLAEINIGRIGNYSHVVSYQTSKGYWKPLKDSDPYDGTIGEICSGSEVKMEVRCPIERVNEAVCIIKEIHPYEEPVIDIIPLINEMTWD